MQWDKLLKQITRLPEWAQYRFDDAPAEGRVRKSTRRTIITKAFARFEAREVIRENPAQPEPCRSEALSRVVPKGANYGYDLITHVGVRTFMDGCNLREIQSEVAGRFPGIEIPISSLHDLRYKFLFYFGHLHRQAAPRLKTYFEESGMPLWLIDGTLEPNTPVFFGVQEARHGILLNCTKMPAEHADDIASCLTETGRLFGDPKAILRDLSPSVEQGINRAYPDVPQFVCHYHFGRALGEALYTAPQNALVKRLRAMKLQVRLKHQRSDQTSELRRELEATEAQTVLVDLLRGRTPVEPLKPQLAREVLLACHYWILDYFSDGQRQGFPFDPYSLYLHRRLIKAQQALQSFLEHTSEPNLVPMPLRNLTQKLTEYSNDPIILDAAGQFETAYKIFKDVREVLRLNPQGNSPMRDEYDLKLDEQVQLGHELQELRAQLDVRGRNASNAKHQKLYQIAVDYLDKYSPYLPNMQDGPDVDLLTRRTTNSLEAHWGTNKKGIRVIHGRAKLTRDFQAQPSELMLLHNLHKPEYVRIILGRMENLADKLAEAGRTAGSFTAWKKKNRMLKLGQLPAPVLRSKEFLGGLLQIFEQSIQLSKQSA